MEGDSRRLCKACGACCNGYVFRTLPLDGAKEIKLLSGENINIVVEGETHVAILPCYAFDGECTVYGQEKRPRSCDEFKCWLLTQVEEEQMELPKALNIVEKFMRSGARIFARLPKNKDCNAGENSLFAIMSKTFDDGVIRELKEKDHEFILEITVFRFMREKYFLDHR